MVRCALPRDGSILLFYTQIIVISVMMSFFSHHQDFFVVAFQPRRAIAQPSLLFNMIDKKGPMRFMENLANQDFEAQPPESATGPPKRVTCRGRKSTFHELPNRIVYFIFVSLLLTVLVRVGKASALSRVPSLKSPSALPSLLGIRHMLAAGSLIILLGGLGLSRFGLISLSQQLLMACARCTLQLQLVGGMVLQMLLPISRSWIIIAWILGVGTIAAQEAYGRLDFTYPALRRHLTLSFLTAGLSVLAYAIYFKVFGTLEPWYQPKTIIPVAGMLFGNTLSAVTLAASTMMKEFAVNQNQVELWLARGATYQEAVLPLTKESIKTALTPTINALSVTGIVHVPGMMTGQILAGQSPRQAAVYQTIIWFMIASVATLAVQLLSIFITGALVDKQQHRLRLNKLVDSKTNLEPAQVNFEKGSSSGQRHDFMKAEVLHEERSNADDDVKISRSSTILKIDELCVDRVRLTFSLDVCEGDRVGITGESGVGKSQILRTIAGLEEIKSVDLEGSPTQIAPDVLQLRDTPISHFSLPEWRAKVCLISQDRPATLGTPRSLYQQIRSFKHQRTHANSSFDPARLACDEWNLAASTFDRPWSTLSGGEAQRASLAIALALEPDVLLLDEFGSALDDTTCKLVEATLKRIGMPLIVVTHSKQQLERFCNRHIDLPSSLRRT